MLNADEKSTNKMRQQERDLSWCDKVSVNFFVTFDISLGLRLPIFLCEVLASCIKKQPTIFLYSLSAQLMRNTSISKFYMGKLL